MWKLGMKVWIVTIMLNAVSCKVTRHNEILARPANINIKYADRPSPAPCASCGSNPSLSLPFDQNPYDDRFNYPDNTQSARREELGQFNDENERSNAVEPPSGRCRPELQLYVFGDPNDSSVVYEPKCTRINRCSGCCNSNFRSCQPSNKTMTNFRVLKKNDSGSGMTFGRTIVSVEEHLSCECRCAVNHQNCSIKAEYDPRSCRCECKNTDEKKQCEREHVLRRWDVDSCSCLCRKIESCQTGFGFDPSSCGCQEGYVPKSIQGRNGHDRRTSFMNRYTYEAYHSNETQQRKHKDEPNQ